MGRSNATLPGRFDRALLFSSLASLLPAAESQSFGFAPEPSAARQIFGPLPGSKFFHAVLAGFGADLCVFAATGLAATGHAAG